MKRAIGSLAMGLVLATASTVFANHDTTTPQQPGLSGPEVLYVLAKDSYLVVDPASLKVLTTVKVGGCFSSLVPTGDGKLVYASNPCLNAVVVIDPATHKVIDLLKVGEQPGADMRLSPDWKTIWVRTLDGVSVIDAATRKVLSNIRTGETKLPERGARTTFVPSAAGRPTLLYVTNPPDNTVTAIDVDRRTVVATVPVGKNPRFGMAYSKLSDRVYVLDPQNSEISVIDPSVHRVVKKISVPQKGLGGIGFTHDGRFAGIDSRHERGGGDSLLILDAKTDSIVSTIDLRLSGTPTAATVNPTRLFFTLDDRLGFALHKTSPHVSVVDMRNLKLAKLIELPSVKKEVLFRCSVLVSQDGRTVYVTSAVEETVTVIDVASLTVRAVIHTKEPTCSLHNFRVASAPR